MNRIITISAMFAAAVFLAGGCGKNDSAKTESIADIQKREGVPITVVRATRKTLAAIERLGGNVEGYQQASLSASIPANVAAINIRVGQSVEKGAVLIKLDPNTASPYAMAKANYETTEKSMGRLKALQQEGGVSQDVVDQIQTGYEVARANLDGARKAENIIAPFSGVVVELAATENAVVGPGQTLVKLAALSRVRVRLNVSEAIISRFAVGQKAIIVSGGDSCAGSVEKVSLAADESNHTFTVETIFSNSNNRFRPGMYVTVDVVTRQIKDALTLPMESVVSEGENKFVFAINDGVAAKTPVTVGIRSGDNYEIISGVEENGLVALAGVRTLSDGMRVRVVQ